ncbi:hypothetical protein BDE02_17G086900 [Populus trichocarpa]|nr:hypothetical protein BDE02_17G086900 [Populus trichocarpa]
MIFLFQYMIRYGFCLFQEKSSTLMDKAGNAAQYAKESVQRGWSTGDVYGTGSCSRNKECNWHEQMN